MQAGARGYLGVSYQALTRRLVVFLTHGHFFTVRRREQRGETLNEQDRAYLERAKQQRRKEAQANEALELIDKLEQDEDVQKVYHTLA